MTLISRLHGPAPLIMGILNVTPDSFSDGGMFTRPETAVAHALRMVEEGADILDIGGESTRPGSRRVDAEEQIRRTCGVIRALRAHVPAKIAISIDTTLPAVAREALNAGADLINDIHAGGEPGMIELAAERRAPIVIMHMQGTPETMQREPRYDDVVAEVFGFLRRRATECVHGGLGPGSLILDPGFGFGKNLAHNVALLRHLPDLVAGTHPVLVGLSRKSMIGGLVGEPAGQAAERLGGSLALALQARAAGVRMVRVHDVGSTVQAFRVMDALEDHQ